MQPLGVHWHRHGVAQDQRLLAGLQSRQYFLQPARAADAHQHRLDVLLFVQQGCDARADLAHHLGIDLAGPLVDDEERHVVFAQLARDRAEDGVAGDGRIEELVRFLDRDHQRRRLGGLVAEGVFLLLHVFLMQAAGQEVGNEYVSIQHVAIAAKLQHDVVLAIH